LATIFYRIISKEFWRNLILMILDKAIRACHSALFTFLELSPDYLPTGTPAGSSLAPALSGT